MIHQLTVLNRNRGVGITLFDNSEMYVDPDLLIGLVQALMALGEEMGPVKGPLREAELGKYQISILSRDNLVYIAIHDTYDSEPFTKRILQAIIDKHHGTLLETNFHLQLGSDTAIQEDVERMLTTMKFPTELIDDVEEIIQRFLMRINHTVDTIMLTDLDDGIIKIFFGDDENIIRILMEILSEIPFERHWMGQSRLKEPKIIDDNEFQHEVWLIYQIGLTDFCLMGRGYYSNITDQDTLILQLEQLVEEISSLLFTHDRS